MTYQSLKEDIIKQGQRGAHTPLRKWALQKIQETTVPNEKEEDWRFTDLTEAFERPLDFSNMTPAILKPELLNEYNRFKEFRLIFLNGHLMTNNTLLPEGTILKRKDEDGIESSEFFDLTNALFAEESIEIVIPPKSIWDRALSIIHVATEEGHDSQHSPRLRIVVGKQSEVTINEFFVTQGDFYYFSNPMTQVVIEEGARVEHCLMQDNGKRAVHVGKNIFTLARDSFLNTFSLNCGSQLSRQNMLVDLNHEGASAKMNGVYALTDAQEADQFLTVNHHVGQTTSEQLYKGILAERSHGIFTGKIFIHKDAQNANAAQLNNNLLLGDKAKINTRPQLEIYADDVKCTHGATVGQLDAEQLFYLESRGIPKDRANKMILAAFASQVLMNVKNESLRNFFLSKVEAQFQRN